MEEEILFALLINRLSRCVVYYYHHSNNVVGYVSLALYFAFKRVLAIYKNIREPNARDIWARGEYKKKKRI